MCHGLNPKFYPSAAATGGQRRPAIPLRHAQSAQPWQSPEFRVTALDSGKSCSQLDEKPVSEGTKKTLCL